MAPASCRILLDHLEHNGQSGRSCGTPAVFVSLSSPRTSRPASLASEGHEAFGRMKSADRLSDRFGLVAQLVRAVSYTHLEENGEDIVMVPGAAYPSASGSSCARLVRDSRSCPGKGSADFAPAAKVVFDSVSYTHLDVYKRQA